MVEGVKVPVAVRTTVRKPDDRSQHITLQDSCSHRTQQGVSRRYELFIASHEYSRSARISMPPEGQYPQIIE